MMCLTVFPSKHHTATLIRPSSTWARLVDMLKIVSKSQTQEHQIRRNRLSINRRLVRGKADALKSLSLSLSIF